MGGSAAGLIGDLLELIINIYIIMLFVRLFIAEYERYDAILDMIFQATDPIVVPLTTALRTRSTKVVPVLLIVVLLLVKGMLMGSIPVALQGFFRTLLWVYALTIIVTVVFREAYLNPIVSFGQRMVRPIRNTARYLTQQPMAINVLSLGILVILYTVTLFVLFNLYSMEAQSVNSPLQLPGVFRGMEGGGGDDLVLMKKAFICSLRLIVDLTWFFFIVLILYVFLSWFSPDPGNPLVQLLTLIAMPMLEPLQRVLPPIAGVIDISPMIAMFALLLVNGILHGVLNAF